MRRGLAWLVVVLWMGLIFELSAVPSLHISPGSMFDYVARKIAHMLVFGVLALIILRAAAGWKMALVLTVAYATTDEVHQSFVPGRHADAVDIGFDTVGAVLALWLAQRVVTMRVQNELRRQLRVEA